MAALRTWLKCVCVFSFVCGVVTPLLLFVLTNGYDDLDTKTSPFIASVRGFEGKLYSHERKPLDFSEVQQVSSDDMQYKVQELQRIVVSVRNELRQLEQERSKVRKELDMSKKTLSKVRKEVGVAKSALQDSKGKLAKTIREMKRVNQYDGQVQVTNSPVVVVNIPVEERVQHGVIPNPQTQTKGQRTSSSNHCFDEVCFDYARCPLTRSFSVYVYNQHHSNLFDLRHPDMVKDLVVSLGHKHSLASDPDLACIFVVIVGPLKVEMDEKSLWQKLESLPHWKDGSGHVVVELAYHNQSLKNPPASSWQHASLGRSIRAKSYVTSTEEKGYDILLPPVTRHEGGSKTSWKGLPPFLPALRDILVTFEGTFSDDASGTGFPLGRDPTWVNSKHLTTLKEAIKSNTKDKVVISAKCNSTNRPGVKEEGTKHPVPVNHYGEWLLCGTPQQRSHLLSQSTFSLIIGSLSGIMGRITYTRLIEGLRYGAIPVILGVRHLPFDSVIDWKQAAVVLPSSSLGQLHYVLRNIDEDTILKYRRQGRFLWETYFSSPLSILDTVVAIVRQRALHPPPAAPQYVDATNLASVPGDENRVIPSHRFLYNFTSYSVKLWNSPPGAFYMYPTTPFKPTPMSGSQYVNMNSNQVARLPPHVAAAGGITGPFFEDYLLGNSPEEQFTVIMLTYERNDVLLEALGRLKDLDHLAKVVVVWNNPSLPPAGIKWPEMGVPVDVVSVGRNSLNNRFLPFSNIDTEAVLSIDDDVHLRHDEIQFAFRVWREARDRVVGFPGRFHAWDARHPGWLYNSNYTCELSMVLTGAAFLHKYYMFLYSQWMYSEARDMVDRYTNCEDIAMNFLVSHITRKPPLKVTTRWTFRCPGCPETLSNNDEHFQERHVCMNELVHMFGYMPLLYTQFRLDSVLFKTRLPTHLEKCYEFV